jgi:hypothetical protein
VDNTLLQQLKDIHNPAPISWWPLAIGWYGVIFITLLVLGCLGFLLYRYRQKQKRQQLIFQQLTSIEEKLLLQDPTAVSDCSVLLRKIALLNFPRQDVAGLHGEAWLKFLDQTGKTQDFSHGCGRLLITVAYQQQWNDTATQLLPLIKRWMQQCLK